jgi:hypothetical protein
MKAFPAIVTAVCVWYVADAICPTWEWSCSGRQTSLGIMIGPGELKAFANHATHAVDPDRPEGCTLHANNLMRRLFDRFMV